MNLKNSKATFLKNIEKDSGLVLTVIDYDGLIQNIQKIAQKELRTSIATEDDKDIQETFSKILDINRKGELDDIHLLFNFKNIQNIKSSYIVQLYNEGKLSNLKEKEIQFTQKNYEDAFKLKLIEIYLSSLVNDSSYKFYFGNFLYILYTENFVNYISLSSRFNYDYVASFKSSDQTYIRAKNIPVIDLDDSTRDRIISEFKNIIFSFFSRIKERTKEYENYNNSVYYQNIFEKADLIRDMNLDPIFEKFEHI